MEMFTIIILSLSGLLLTLVGLLRLTKPVNTYLKNSGITIPNDVNLLNEIRGVSAVMLSSGIIILLGTFINQIRIFSLVIAILVFIGFGIGRIISVMVDGKPNKQIIQGLIFEFVFGALNIFVLLNLIK